jgi:hypothetical protein
MNGCFSQLLSTAKGSGSETCQGTPGEFVMGSKSSNRVRVRHSRENGNPGFRKHEIEPANTHSPAVGYAVTEFRIISRKDAKAARENIYPTLAFLASWREECPNPRMLRILENLPKPRKFSSIVVRATCVFLYSPVYLKFGSRLVTIVDRVIRTVLFTQALTG